MENIRQQLYGQKDKHVMILETFLVLFAIGSQEIPSCEAVDESGNVNCDNILLFYTYS